MVFATNFALKKTYRKHKTVLPLSLELLLLVFHQLS